MSYAVVDYDTFTHFAKETLPYLLSIQETMKQLFILSQSDDNQIEKPVSLLEKAYVFLTEGSDFTHEKVFETPHPYPRGEIIQKDVFHVPKAIAFAVELDRRCSTESNTDCLVI